MIRYVNSTISRALVWEFPVPLEQINNLPEANFAITLQGEFDANLPLSKARQGLVLRVSVMGNDFFTTCGQSTSQSTISQSTTESELKAASWCARAVIGESNLIREIFPTAEIFRVMVGDNGYPHFGSSG